MNQSFGTLDPAPDWVCECADRTCVEKVALSLAEYEALRSEPRHFAVFPGPSHVVPDVENVVGKTERYWIVQKIGTAGALVEEQGEKLAEGAS
jgi:hypothetical protein